MGNLRGEEKCEDPNLVNGFNSVFPFDFHLIDFN